MARIRTIKPEFWTSEQIMECSPIARLLFIGMLNFCDDGGNHPASAKTLKAEVFPGDNLAESGVQSLLDELLGEALIIPYEADGKGFWHVTGWHHQKIDKPTFKHPRPPSIDARSPTSSREVVEASPPEGKGKETKGRKHIAIGKPDCPHQEIIALYHEILPASPRIKDWTPARAASLKARWNEETDRQTLDYWRRLFEYISGIPFLNGKVSSNGRKPFVLSLDWMLKADNFAKVREGRYEDSQA